MAYIFGVGCGGESACGYSSDRSGRLYVSDHYCSGPDTGSGAYLGIVDHAHRRPYIHAVAYHWSAVWEIGADGGKLADIHIVAYDRKGIDDDALGVLDVESGTDDGARRYEEPVATLVGLEAQLGERVEPAFVLCEAKPEREAHTGAREPCKPHAEEALTAPVVAEGIGFDEPHAIGIAFRHRDGYFSPGDYVVTKFHYGRQK